MPLICKGCFFFRDDGLCYRFGKWTVWDASACRGYCDEGRLRAFEPCDDGDGAFMARSAATVNPSAKMAVQTGERRE